MPTYQITPAGTLSATITGTRPFKRVQTGGKNGAWSIVDANHEDAGPCFGMETQAKVFADTDAALADADAVVTAANNSPVNTVSPAITGTAQVGQVLTAADGTWTGTPAVAKTRQWFANGVAIAGATGATYTPVVGDIGKTITVTVTGTNSAGVATATSATTAAVIAA